MGARLGTSFSNNIIASPAAAAETVVATTGGVNLITDTAAVFLFWLVQFTVGTSGVSANVKLRRGASTAGTLINVGQATTVAAGNLITLSGTYVDTPGASAELQYSLSLTVGSAAAASAVSDVMIIAMVL